MQVITHSSPQSERVLYSRDADGGHEVRELPAGGYRLETPKGVKTFESRRQLLIAITGHPKARNWTFDRYFRVGQHEALTPTPVASLLDWFSPKVEPSSPKVGLGIDLVNRGHEVKKLLFKVYGGWIRQYKYDPDEVLQELYASLLVRNKGKCPWDKRVSTFGNYVCLVARGTLSNFHRKKRRIRECEVTGTYGFSEDGTWGMMNVAEANIPGKQMGEVARMEMLEVTDDLLEFIPKDSSTYLARKVLPLVRDGYTRTDIARKLGVNRTVVMAATVELQGWTKRWYVQNV